MPPFKTTRLPPPYTDTELDVLSDKQRRVLDMRFGLVDGRTYIYRQIGEACGLSKGGARAVEKDALRKIAHRRDPEAAFRAGVRMVEVEKTIPPLPPPDAKGGVARRRRFKGGHMHSSWVWQIGSALQEGGLDVLGEEWSLRRRGEEQPERGWAVFCEEAGDRRIAAVYGYPGYILRALVLGVIPPSSDDPAAITNWLWRSAIEYQWGPNSLAFLVGGLSVLLEVHARFRSAGALVSAALDTKGRSPAGFPVDRREEVASAVLEALDRDLGARAVLRSDG
jgi:Sigma-70, region 4